MLQLSGKVAIVTGAASGIGEATATVLARQGASVVAADINGEGARRLAAELTAEGRQALGVTVDVADEAAIEAMVDAAVQTFGGLDILHNNAALTGGAAQTDDLALVDIDAELLDRVLRVNVGGYVLGTKHAIPRLLERGGGVIVNTSSIDAVVAELVRPMYSMSKAAVDALTHSIATQYGRQGIRAVGVAPGVIITPAVRAVVPQALLDGFARHTVTPRLGVPEDVANLVAFLVSDAASYITGTTVRVDGGFTTHWPDYADQMDARAAATAR